MNLQLTADFETYTIFLQRYILEIGNSQRFVDFSLESGAIILRMYIVFLEERFDVNANAIFIS